MKPNPLTIRRPFAACRPRTASAFLAALAVLATTVLAGDPPVDALDRGQAALDRGQYRQAAEQFERAAEQAADGARQAEALYWYAFALSRLGETQELQRAAAALSRLEALAADQHLRQEALTLATRVNGELARHGDARAAQALAVQFEEQSNQELKVAALQAMMHLNPDRALPVLTELLQRRTPETVELRRQAMILLGQNGLAGTGALLADIARQDPDPEVRGLAVFWLGHTGAPEALPLFRELLGSSQDPLVLERVIIALHESGDPVAGPLLREVAADPQRDRDVRRLAILCLGRTETPSHQSFLRDLYGQVDDPRLKDPILITVAERGGPDASAWLVAIALDEREHPETRRLALFWAGRQGLLPVARLGEIYTRSADRQLREQIIFVLAENGSPEALQRLMASAREEEDHGLRRQAVFWIGQTGGEDAEAFLLEIIRQ